MSESKKRKRDETDVPESTVLAAVDDTEADTPVQSHKERRRARKLEQKLSTLGTTDTPNIDDTAELEDAPIKSEGKSKKADKPKEDPVLDPLRQPRQNSVWVGNLAYKTREDDLRKFFDGVGEITRIYLPTKKVVGSGKGMRGDNMGFAYVDFVTADAKTIAITLSEGNLDGRKLLIKDGSDFSGRPTAATTAIEGGPTDGTTQSADAKPLGSTHTKTERKILNAQTQPASTTLFMGNLPFQATEESIKGMLEAHRISRLAKKAKRKPASEEKEGEEPEQPAKDLWLRKIRLGTFEDSGKCKGWAFLDFVSVEEATSSLLDIRNHHMDGRDIKLEYASPDATRRGESKSSKGLKRKPPGEGEAQGRDYDGPPPRKRQARSRPIDNEPSEREERLKARLERRNQAQGITDEPEAQEELEPEAKPSGKSRDERRKADGKPKYKAKTRPGAALAMAKRESVAIVKSEGTKIKFD